MRHGGSKNSVKSDKLLKGIEELSPAHVSVLESELAKLPSLNHYYRKKFSSKLSEKLSLPEKLIQTWIKLKADFSRPSNTVPSKETTTVEKKPNPTTTSSDTVAQTPSIKPPEDQSKLIEKQSSRPSEPPVTTFPKVKVEVKEPSVQIKDEYFESETNQDDLMFLRKQCEDLRTELRQKLEFCENLKEKTQEFIKSFKNHSREKEEELKEIRDKLSEKEEEIKKLQVSESQLKSQTNLNTLNLEKQMKDMSSTITELKQTLKSKEELLKNETSRGKNLQTKLEQCSKNFKETLLLKQETAANKKEEEMRKKFCVLEEGFKKKSKKEAEEKDLLKKSLVDLKKIVNQKENQLQGKLGNIQKLEKSVSQLKEEKISLFQKVRQLEKQVTEKEETIKMKMNQIRSLEEQEDSLQHRLRSLEHQLGESQRAKLKMQEKFKTLILHGKSDLVDAQAVIKKFRTDMMNKDSAIEELKKSLQNLKKIVVDKDQEISGLKEDILDKTSNLKSSEDEAVQLKKTLSERENEIELIHSKYQEKDCELSEKEEAVEKLKLKIVAINNEFERELDKRNSEEIQHQNVVRDLQLREQETREHFLAELETSRVSSENCLRDLKAKAKLETEEKLCLKKRLEEKIRLVGKMKQVLLYRESEIWAARVEIPLLHSAANLGSYPTSCSRDNKRSLPISSDQDDLSPPAKKIRVTVTSQIIDELLLDLITGISDRSRNIFINKA